jgi:nitroreductase
MARSPEAPIDEQFLSRWSPRAFKSDPPTDEQVASLFEAARWAPSCYNEQPWLFVYATRQNAADHDRMASLLVDGNRTWAEKAPVLGIVFARRRFARNDKPNRWAAFDTGAASMSLTLQANKMGLVTHFMGGIHEDRCYEALGVPEHDYEAMAGFAVGYQGAAADLPDNLREREVPSGRKPLREVAFEGRFQT